MNKNAEKLCRGKWSTTFNSRLPLNCIEGDNLNLSAKELAGKTLVLRGGNLLLSEYQEAEQTPLTIFIDKGNLLLPEEVTTGNLISFDSF